MLSLDIAHGALVAMIVLLALVFIFLLAYTFWTRTKKQYWHRYEEKFRDYFLPLVLEFIEEGESKEDADDVIFKLTKRTQDISFFLNLLDEMSAILKGEERDKLNMLIEHELFSDFYKKKLFSYKKRKKLLACIYYEHLTSLSPPIVNRLLSLSKANDVELAYAATKALQSSNDIELKKNVLLRFFKRDDIPELMVAELLHLFHSDNMEEHRMVGKALIELITDTKLTPFKKKTIILYLAQQNFFEYADFLLDYLKELDYQPSKAPLVVGLIKALGELYVPESAPVIRKYLQVENVEIRLTCVETLCIFGGKENLIYLTKSLLYIEFAVRKAIIENLSQNPELGHPLLFRFLTHNLEFVLRYKKERKSQKELNIIFRNIHSVALGIKIMLTKRLNDGRV